LVTWRAASRNSLTQTRCTGFSLSCPESQPMRNHPAGMRTSAGMYSFSCARDRESSSAGSVGSMVSHRPQRADDVLDLILLEQADAGDAGRSRFQAQRGVLHRDAAESQNGDLRPAGFTQGGDAGGWRCRSASFSEYRSEDREIGVLRFGSESLGGSVAGNGHEKVVSGQRMLVRSLHDSPNFPGRNIVRTQVNAIGSRGEGDVGEGVDEQTSSQFPVLSSQWSAVAHGSQGFP